MRILSILFAATILTLSACAQQQPHVPQYACFGGVVFIDSAGLSIAHHVRSNVFEISHFNIDFDGSPAQWADLEARATAEANKQIAASGYSYTIQYPVLLSNFGSEQQTQDALDIWNSRTPADLTVEFAAVHVPRGGR
jgi:hypothetical protein